MLVLCFYLSFGGTRHVGPSNHSLHCKAWVTHTLLFSFLWTSPPPRRSILKLCVCGAPWWTFQAFFMLSSEAVILRHPCWLVPCFPAAAQLPRYSGTSRSSPKPKQLLQKPTALRGNGLKQLEAVQMILHTDMCTTSDTLKAWTIDECRWWACHIYGAEKDVSEVH